MGEVRDETLANLGIRIEDSADVSIWKMDDPAVIRKEVEERRTKAAEAAAKKVQAKVERLTGDIQKAHQSSVSLQVWFQTSPNNTGKWGTFADDGTPLTTKDKKESNNQQKAHDKLLKVAGEQGSEKYIAQLEQE